MKQYTLKLIGVLLFFAMLSACKKEAPIDSQTPVQFKFDGTINGQPVLFEAGENNYYLNTNYTDKGTDDVLLMSGTFENKTDPTADYLRFEFYGYDSARNTAILQNVFSQQNYPSYSQDSALQNVGNYQFRFSTLFSTGATNTWDFGDGSPTATGDSVVHTYTQSSGTVNVKMTSNNALLGCTETITNTLNLDDIFNGQVQFNINAATVDSFVCTAIASPAFNNFVWNLDNTLLGQGMSAVALLNDSLSHEVELQATGPTMASSWKGRIQAGGMACFAAFYFTPISVPTQVISIRKPYRTAIITYRKNGTVYSSFKNDGTDQSGQIVFVKSEAQAYEKNENGQSTISLRGAVNTFLYNVANPNDSISIVSGNVSTAVAHP